MRGSGASDARLAASTFPEGGAGRRVSARAASVPARPPACTPGNRCRVPGGFPRPVRSDKGRFGMSLAVLTGKGQGVLGGKRSCPSSPAPSAPPPGLIEWGSARLGVLSPQGQNVPTPLSPKQERLRPEGKEEGPCQRLRVEPRWVTTGSFQAAISSWIQIPAPSLSTCVPLGTLTPSLFEI